MRRALIWLLALILAPAAQAGVDYETQTWWVQGQTGLTQPAAGFPFASNHVHLLVRDYPLGETIQPQNGFYVFDTAGLVHNGVGAKARFIRGGNFQSGETIPKCSIDRTVTAQDERFSCTLRRAATIASGKHENRFTFDTTSPFGQRQYQSGAWWTFVGQPGAPVPVTARGWYQGGDYVNVTLKDSNLGAGTGFRASYLAQCVPDAWTISYALAQGARFAFFYLDANIHEGSKGAVVAENKTGDTGSVIANTSLLEPGTHTLTFGGWEKTGAGWSAGVGKLPFRVC